jgi:hypothetical protein
MTLKYGELSESQKKAVSHMRNLKWSVSSTLNTSHTNSINLYLFTKNHKQMDQRLKRNVD